MLNDHSFVYDTETFSDAFVACFLSVDGKQGHRFELSSRRDDNLALRKFLGSVYRNKGYLIGYNNASFDWPVLSYFLHNKGATSQELHELANEIIKSAHDPATKYKYRIKNEDCLIKQIDLMALNGYNSKARSVALKTLEFNLRLNDIEDLPYKPDASLDEDQIENLAKYCEWDVWATYLFMRECMAQIQFRAEMTAELEQDMLNASDNDVGKAIFSKELEKNDPECLYKKVSGGKRVRNQTKRDKIDLGEVLFDYYDLSRPEFIAIKDWFASRTITETKGVFSDLPEHELGGVAQYAVMVTKKKKIHTDEQLAEMQAKYPLGWLQEDKLKSGKVSKNFYYRIAETLNVVVDGMRYDYGTGGIHGARDMTIFEESDEWVVASYDFASYYPHLSFKNGVYPEHLGKDFCKIYNNLYIRRLGYAKGTSLNTGIKLALNTCYGNSNDKFSSFYDPKFTMTITINGQLTLTMLCDALMRKFGKDVRVVTVNSDGAEFMHRRSLIKDVEAFCDAFGKYVGIALEGDYYTKFIVNNINSYIAVNTKGKLKNKGMYVHKTKAVGGGGTDQSIDGLEWHKNHSSLVIPKAAEHELLGLGTVEDFIEAHNNMWDYLILAKVNRSSSLYLKTGDELEKLQNINRVYVSTDGGELVKKMPALEKSESGEERESSFLKGATVTVANKVVGDITNRVYSNLDKSWYCTQARKLVDGFTTFNPEFD